VRLMDFGIAKQWDAGDAEKMTQTGQVVGTPDYMSPEQIRGQPTDARSDIYALGVILFELLTGETPFRAESPVATVLKQLKEPPPLEAAGLPAPVRPVLERALAKDPALRYPTARDFGAALERLLARSDETATTFVPRLPETLRDAPPTRPWAASMGAGETDSIVAERAVPPARPGRATSRRIGWVGALLVVAALGGLILVGRWMSERRTEGDRVPESTEVTLPPATLPTEDRLPEPTPTAAPVETARSEGVARPAPQASDRSRLSESPLNEARSALERGDYDAALQRAQAILGADPGNTDARGVSEKAAAGKAAGEHLGSATRLLQEGKHGEALDEVALARQLAPWDARAAALATRIREAQARAGRSRVEGLLSQAEKALVAADYDAAIRLYDAVLEADPNNSIAKMSRATAINARVAERALSTAPEAPSGRRLVAGKAEAVEGGKEPELSDAFELTPDIAVTRDTVDAALPGRIEFESTPEVLRAGDSYSLRILLDNRGRAPIGIREVIVTSTVNGKRSTGPVPVLATEVAPGQKATLLSLSDFLRDDTREWTMEVLVRTTRGEAYRRRLVWK
jgi:tetratricopeptide (TPR) repeat protein